MRPTRSDGRLSALKEHFTPTAVELMTFASSPNGGMNPLAHTGHVVFAASTAQPARAPAEAAGGEQCHAYFELRTIESTGSTGEHWPAGVEAGVQARLRKFQRLDDGSWRYGDLGKNYGAPVAAMRMV